MGIYICKSEKRGVLDEEDFKNEESLCEAIKEYCDNNKLSPIYIDRNIAIFKDHYLLAFNEEDLELLKKDSIKE